MTFEKVINVFSDYLKEDSDCEVILTKHGYTLLIWDKRAQGWSTSEYCSTPEILCDMLLDAYSDLAELKITHARRELTEEECADIDAACNRFREQCK